MLRSITPRFSFAVNVTFPSVNHKPAPYNGPAYEKVVGDRKTWMPNFYFHYYEKPLLIVEGHMQYLYDHTGKRYIDLISGISTVSCGHAHPTISKVADEQMRKVSHTSPIYFSEVQG
jgi:alanine-glyoxylate transaminase / (R)-3-amino-2-methylpropionate-pyruvate transaminase